MGSKQTKIEGEYLPQTPTHPITVRTDYEDLENILDPRSPHICRTPLNEIAQRRDVELYHQVAPIAAIATEHPVGLLRKRFFKGFSYNLNDPRSPSTFLNRTPLMFDELADKTLNLDDTFSDLFVESKIPQVDPPIEDTATPLQDEESPNEASTSPLLQEEKETLNEAAATPKIQQQEGIAEVDPRSPSIGVDRTPIIFTDDAGAEEEDIIENILSTLSLNISRKIPENKPLERIRNKKKVLSKAAFRNNMIYEDGENHTTSTPSKLQKVLDSPSNAKRTPLSCVKNNPQLRSRSVEISGKSIKSRLPLTSFDDTLHKITPVKKILRYSNMENIENSFEF